MTPQEAINCIDEVLSSDCNYDETLDYQLISYDFDWLEKAKNSLEKQIPKKAKIVNRIRAVLETTLASVAAKCHK